MMWKNKNPDDFIFMDKNTDAYLPPDIFAVWENLPFRDNVFETIFFDPPHKFNRTSGFWADPKSRNYYGADIRRNKLITGIIKGTEEFYRVAKRLCLKWCDDEIKLHRVLSCIYSEWENILEWRDNVDRAHGNHTWWITFGK